MAGAKNHEEMRDKAPSPNLGVALTGSILIMDGWMVCASAANRSINHLHWTILCFSVWIHSPRFPLILLTIFFALCLTDPTAKLPFNPARGTDPGTCSVRLLS